MGGGGSKHDTGPATNHATSWLLLHERNLRFLITSTTSYCRCHQKTCLCFVAVGRVGLLRYPLTIRFALNWEGPSKFRFKIAQFLESSYFVQGVNWGKHDYCKLNSKTKSHMTSSSP